MMQSPHRQNLDAVNRAQKENFCNRASAVFPVKLSQRANVRLLFLNYWSLKNGIERVQANIRVYDAAGKRVFRSTKPVEGTHCDLSLRDLVGTDLVGTSFDGMVEIELISPENLVFAFPAITAIYEGDGAFSAVHSAGRIRNTDEPISEAPSEETNWICKTGPGCTPFAHVFNGPRPGSQPEVVLRIYSADNQELGARTLPGPKAAFASELLCFDDVFSAEQLAKTAFASVTVQSNEVFPRLVVGNYHRNFELLEATHSFPHMGSSTDYVEIPASSDFDLLAYLPLPQPAELELECRLHPTTAATQLVGTRRGATAENTPLTPRDGSVRHVTGGPEGRLLRLRAEPDDRLGTVDFRTGRIPARTTICHAFRVRGTDAPFSTDISAGVSPLITPVKKHHWGHGLVSRDIDTVVMLNNVAFRPSERKARRGKLTVYTADAERTVPVSVEAESVSFVRLRDVLGDDRLGETPKTLSWMLRLEDPGLEAFWVSYSSDGRICGDHAF